MDQVKVHSKERLLPGKNLKLNQFKLLGINYDAFTEDKTAINLKKKTNRKKRTL